MGIFDQLFGNKKEASSEETTAKPTSAWIPLTSIEQLSGIAEASSGRTQVIFKHSTRCGISRMALNLFEREQLSKLEDADVYFLDLIKHRDVSNEIAAKFGVEHQSPQVLVIRDQKVVTHASHNGIGELKAEAYV